MMTILKRIFGIGKTYKKSEDGKIEYAVADLKIGYILEYDMLSWEVTDIMEYTWDNGVKDFEYTITNGSQTYFLNRSDGNLSLYWKGKLAEVWPEARKFMQEETINKQHFNFEGKSFHFAGTGYARCKNKQDSFEMENWLFESEDEENLASFNKYEDASCEVYLGKYLEKFEIGNILPR